jgi:hypothetical protein
MDLMNLAFLLARPPLQFYKKINHQISNLQFPLPIKLTATIYTEILLKVVLNTIKQTNHENNINTTLSRCKNMRNPYSYNSQSCIQLSSSGEKENDCFRQFTAYLKSNSDSINP